MEEQCTTANNNNVNNKKHEEVSWGPTPELAELASGVGTLDSHTHTHTNGETECNV